MPDEPPEFLAAGASPAEKDDCNLGGVVRIRPAAGDTIDVAGGSDAVDAAVFSWRYFMSSE
jgi:hypothetical protein